MQSMLLMPLMRMTPGFWMPVGVQAPRADGRMDEQHEQHILALYKRL